MLVIYDLDKTSLYCPIADRLDLFVPKNRFLKNLYYKLYPFIYSLEIRFGLIQINENIYQRAKMFQEFGNDVRQVVITARNHTKASIKHIQMIFKDIDVTLISIAQELTGLHKVDVIRKLSIYLSEEIIMYDDNFNELAFVHAEFPNQFTGMQVYFKNNKESIRRVY